MCAEVLSRGEPAPEKVKEVQELKSLMEGKRTVGIVGLSRLPAPELQQIRKKLRGSAQLRVSKNLLMRRSLEELGYVELMDLVNGQSGLIATEMDPFELWLLLKKTVTSGPAKGGEMAEEDIVVHSGETNLKPGPVMGELQSLGIPCKVEKGRIVVQKETVLVRKGEEITQEVARALKDLEINPITIGLKLRGAYADGTIIKPEHLEVDMEALVGEVAKCCHDAFSLAIGLGYFAPETIAYLLVTDHQKALNLGVSLPYFTERTIGPLLSRGELNGRALKSLVER
jgi:large subunit ribosomal protein L10